MMNYERNNLAPPPEPVPEGTASELLPVESYDSGNSVKMAVAAQ